MSVDLDKWANQQIKAAIGLGVNPIDAANAAKRVLAKLPPGADPNTYVLPAAALEKDLSSQSVLDDVRGAWYGDEDVPARFKRLLDAREVK